MLARKPLPHRLALYFHELEPAQYDAFRAGMTHLKELGYRSVGPAQYIGYGAAGGHGSPNDRIIFVSFDDNYRSWHRALPLLAALNITATFYTNTLPLRDECDETVCARYFDRIAFYKDRSALSKAELREIHDAGHEIGCHTHSHYPLATLPRDKWEEEILGCKRRLEDLTGAPVRHFSYPFGMRRFMPRPVMAYCLENGFETIAHGIPCMLHDHNIRPHEIHRSGWRLDRSIAHNIANLEIDGCLFERLTGRSPIG